MARQKQTGLPLEGFLNSLTEHPPQRAPGTAVFMAGNRDALSRAFLQNYACNSVVHERVVLLTVMIRNIPWIRVAEQIKVEPLSQGFYRLTIGFGFMDRPDVSRALERCKEHGLPLDLSKTWFLLSRATIVPTREKGMALWREHLFAVMARNARTAGDYFNIPPGRVIEMGSKIEI